MAELARREVIDRDRRADRLVGFGEARRLARGEHAGNDRGGPVVAVSGVTGLALQRRHFVTSAKACSTLPSPSWLGPG